ncbi:MAG TPA: ATP-binding protein [Dermatophilaceae bacterium]|nr:ATP-binding protein [Dermatophilaceae bacterium]
MQTPAPAVGTASSQEGRAFRAELTPEAPGLPGHLLLLEEDGVTLLGQVLALADGGRQADGVLVGRVDDGRLHRGGRTILSDALVRPVRAEQALALQHATGASLEVGAWRLDGVDVPLTLRPGGFNRHTLLCGQSGSGKTYALGVLLEQLILHTSLPMVVLDPNGDFVHLGSPREEAPPGPAQRIRDSGVRVLRADGAGAAALRVRFVDLPPHGQAAVLALHAVRDRGEYSQWLHLDLTGSGRSVLEVIAGLLAGSDDERALGQRIENLGVGSWQVWPFTGLAAEPEGAPIEPVLPDGDGVTVLDVSGFGDPAEPLVVALDVVERLWARRESRRPTLLVIDEAHNICPAEPRSDLQAAVTERLVQIAAEGRKYGIWLLVSTQRPSKVHPQVVSQCDNLVLMRMNSPADLEDLGRLFGFAPPAMLATSPNFSQGEMLLAGTFVPVPSLGRVGARLTAEGGSDVSVPVGARSTPGGDQPDTSGGPAPD